MITFRQKKINKLLKKNFNELSFEEKIELISNKYYEKQKITYEEFVILLATNDELWFYYNDTEYQVLYESNEVCSMYITKYDGDKKIFERCENFLSVIELLDKFRIEGKTIKDIWNKVSY